MQITIIIIIVFRSPQLKCDVSCLSVNIGERMITQSSNVRDLRVIFDQFLNFDDHITVICRSTHFHIRDISKIKNFLSYDACSTMVHALISCRLDCVITLCTIFQAVKRIDYKSVRINARAS